MKNKTIAVWFSTGAASAVATKITLDKYGKNNNVRVLNNPVKEEDEDNQRFLRDVEKWLGIEVERVINHNYPECSAVEVWDKRQFMSSPHGAPCTLELKKMARNQFEMDNDIDYHVLGFTADEVDRFDRFASRELPNTLPVLIDAGITKSDCYQVLISNGIKLPIVYGLGYPNANCIGCVKATSPTYWNHTRRHHPDVFDARAKQSRNIGARLVRHKGKRIFLDELPLSATGAPLKNMDFECGIFCLTTGE